MCVAAKSAAHFQVVFTKEINQNVCNKTTRN